MSNLPKPNSRIEKYQRYLAEGGSLLTLPTPGTRSEKFLYGQCVEKSVIDTQIINAENSNAEIVDARGEEVNLGTRLDKVDLSLVNIMNKFYDTFPSDATIIAMSNNVTFTTRGFYTKDDGFGCSYFVTTSWKGNALHIGTKYIVPLSQPIGEIFLPYYGVRTGASYALSNSAIVSSIATKEFGSIIKFPSGHFYFDSPLTLSSTQYKIHGSAPVGRTIDTNGIGLTWLHFPNLTDGQACIQCNSATISNIIFYGNSNTYNCVIDRTKTVSNPDSIVTETSNGAKTYGVKSSGGVTIKDCSFIYLYYGVYCNTSNSTVDNIFGSHCNIVLSVGNDTKVTRIFGSDCMTVLQMRGSISSGTTIRGDSIGNHLVHIVDGSSLYLSDLDADYCLKSILHIGDGTTKVIKGLLVNGIHGRSNVYRAYDTTINSEPTVDAILTSANVEEYPIISINKQTRVYSAKITMLGTEKANPMDVVGNYLTPSILLASDVNSLVQNVEVSIIGSLSSEDIAPLTPDWLSKRVKTLASDLRTLEVSVKTAFDQLNYKKSWTTAKYSKLITQYIPLVDTTSTIANSGTITTSGVSLIRVVPTSATTGIILQAGTYNGQEICVINEATTTGYTVTFATSETSYVAGGTSVVIDINSATKFIWDTGTSLWYKL